MRANSQKGDRMTGYDINENIKKTVLVIDGNAQAVEALHRAWQQLQLAENLHIVMDHDKAVDYLRDYEQKKKEYSDDEEEIAAIILDPEMTGEQTGEFMREIRRNKECRDTPILFWTTEERKYQVLEGRGVDAVESKSRILRLIQKLNDECELRVRPFPPFSGRISQAGSEVTL